jgi:hypothetical protein
VHSKKSYSSIKGSQKKPTYEGKYFSSNIALFLVSKRGPININQLSLF